ncbi:MAG: methyl-accepting chemotaxis protein [Bacillota bacterium]|nr:methyl-accepting chemotaxis protein [Bacillota bacterium]
MKLKLKWKFIGVFTLILVSFSIFLFFTVNYEVNNLVKYSVDEKLNSDINMGYKLLDERYKGDWAIIDNKLYKGSNLINNDFSLVDEVKKQTNSFATIFQMDTRVSTNVINKDGKRSINTKASPTVVDTVLNKGIEYKGEVDVVGKKCETRYLPLKDKNGKIVGMFFVGVEKSVLKSMVGRVSNMLILIIVIAIAVGVFALMLLTRRIVNNIGKVQNTLKEVATGNLTLQIDLRNGDEIGEIVDNLNHMIKRISGIIGETKLASEDVNHKAEEMKTNIIEFGRTSEQISIAVSELAKGASEQAQSTETGNDKLVNIINDIRRITSDMKATNELAENAKEKVLSGEVTVQDQRLKMDQSKQASKKVSSAVSLLSQKSEEIGLILDVIKSISEQTNLLALNAAIEAARAGEQGKGFAVVSEEIRKLAEESNKSTIKIRDLIKSIQVDVNETVEDIENAVSSLSSQEEALGLTEQTFEDIKETVNTITNKVNIISRLSDELVVNAESIGSEIQMIASTAEEMAAGTEEVSASSEHQCTVVQYLTSTIQDLTDMSTGLMDSTRKFKI